MVDGARRAVAEGRPSDYFSRRPSPAAGSCRRAIIPEVAMLYAALDVPLVPVALNSGLFWRRNAFLRRAGVITHGRICRRCRPVSTARVYDVTAAPRRGGDAGPGSRGPACFPDLAADRRPTSPPLWISRWNSAVRCPSSIRWMKRITSRCRTISTRCRARRMWKQNENVTLDGAPVDLLKSVLLGVEKAEFLPLPRAALRS